MPGSIEMLILLAGLAILVVFITLVVVGTLKLVNRGKRRNPQTQE